jgi:hypothetical protein
MNKIANSQRAAAKIARWSGPLTFANRDFRQLRVNQTCRGFWQCPVDRSKHPDTPNESVVDGASMRSLRLPLFL